MTEALFSSGAVSIIVVNWNGARYLEQCLASLMNLSERAGEVIVVDNGSIDGSLDIVRLFPSIRLLALDENAGFARGNNLAIEVASQQSAWVALFNPDAVATPNWLTELLAAAERNPAFDVFGSKLLNANDPSRLDGAGDAYHVSGLVWRIGHDTLVSTKDAVPEREVFSTCAAAALYRRCAFSKVGGFDEDYFCYVEDVDLGFRLRLAGYRCLYVPKSVAHHVGSGTTGGQHSDFALYHGHRNLMWTFVKDMPGILFWVLLPLHVAMNLASVLWFALAKRRGGVILRAKLHAMRGLPRMWLKRREIQKARVVSAWQIWRHLCWR